MEDNSIHDCFGHGVILHGNTTAGRVLRNDVVRNLRSGVYACAGCTTLVQGNLIHGGASVGVLYDEGAKVGLVTGDW